MKTTSNSHQDGHAALCALCESSLESWKAELADARIKLNSKVQEYFAWKSLPWWKKHFSLPEPDYSWEKAKVSHAKRQIDWLSKIKIRCDFELGFEFDHRESDILFFNKQKLEDELKFKVVSSNAFHSLI